MAAHFQSKGLNLSEAKQTRETMKITRFEDLECPARWDKNGWNNFTSLRQILDQLLERKPNWSYPTGWSKKARKLVNIVYETIRNSKSLQNDFRLSNQLRGAAISVMGTLWNREMFYVYALISQKDGQFYIGFTEDLKKRLAQHKEGVCRSTSNRRPFELIYYEACRNRKDALHREKYLKTTYGKRCLRNRLKNDLAKKMGD